MRTELLEHLQKKKRYIIVPIMLLVVIILVVVSGTVYTRKLTITRMKESLRDQVQNQTTAMKDKIEGKMSLLGGLAVTITEQELTDYYAMIEKTGVFEKKTDFSEIAFITADARVYSNTGETWVLSDKKHFYSCMNGSYEIDKLKEHGRENDIGIFVPIRVNNRISGVLLGIYPQEKFQELFQETGAGISDVSYIIDFEEGLVVKTDAAEPWESIADQISKEQSGDISYSLDGQNFRCQADSLVRSQGSVGVYVQSQFIVIGNLTHTGILNFQIHTLYRSIDRIYCNHTDRQLFILVLIGAYISATFSNGQFHVKLAVCATVQMCNHHFRIENLDIRIALNISCGYNTFALELNVCDLRVVACAVVADCKILDVHDDLCYIFLNTRNR